MSRVFHLHSTLEIPLETLHEYFESDPDFPEGVEDVEIIRRNNTLVLSAVSEDKSLSKYTPTAQLKATVSDVRIQKESSGPRWGQEEPETELVEMAGFKGDQEAVLQNSTLRYEMFQVLCDLATHAERGEMTAISERDGELYATRIVEGEPKPAAIEVVEDGQAGEEEGIDWQNNEYINNK
ncbi:MAG: hypothetical protein ABEI06_04925 [Halobacteriaceae archaeon]